MQKNHTSVNRRERCQKIMDGNAAAAHVAYAYSEAAAIYPITPSSPMAELCDSWAADGRKTIYGTPMQLVQMQSEAGAAGTMHGALLSGLLATTFTSSQGLLLMIPNLYRMAGELLPGVLHVASRALATHALSIFGDHSDIYACRQTGAAIWACAGVQEVMDLSPVPHLAALSGRIPFISFFDGFRTSHELQKISVWDYETLKAFTDTEALSRFREDCLHPHHAKIYGSAQNPDIFFQTREAANPFYNALPGIVEQQLSKINAALGTDYGLFDYYGAPDATHVLVAMGSICETIREYLLTCPDEKYGLINVHLYRPFSTAHFIQKLPASVRQITVLSRTKEPGAPGEPLYLDVMSALEQSGLLAVGTDRCGSPHPALRVFSGRYGLSSKDTTPGQIAAVYQNYQKKFFTVGITDDVTGLSLPLDAAFTPSAPDTVSCKFWGLGGDGTVSATKNIVKIIGTHTGKEVQGYFEYDSKKSRGLTISHLRFSDHTIRSAYLIHSADFVACHNPVFLHKYRMAEELKDGGSFLLNCPYRGAELASCLPAAFRQYLSEHSIRFYVIDALKIGKETGLNGRISTILQAAFFAVTGLLPEADAKRHMKEAARNSYGKMGEKILHMNETAIDRGFAEVEEISVSELALQPTEKAMTGLDNSPLPAPPALEQYVKTIQQPVTDQRGNELPVSAFLPYCDGATPPGSTAHERRDIATELPKWLPENCIQCNRCSLVCPHAVIRPAVLDAAQAAHAPGGMPMLPMTGLDDHSFAIVISEVDCTGCGACAAVCPGKQGKKALEMHPAETNGKAAASLTQRCFDYAKPLLPSHDALEKYAPHTAKGSQFRLPLMEFSGACSGCGETPYVKLLTQLFGPDLYLANATGCSSIWGNSSPSCAYTTDADGHGPAWSNSLFEDAAEFGLGMLLGAKAHMPNASCWVIGGDGWAYDIGFGGLDHVLSTGRNINLLVLDTEVYSNTGGQASKATPLGATAKFLSGGKRTRKKDLASIAMTYGDVYVAQIALGADFNQTLLALTEAAAYPGPSLVIAYATCIAHGIRSGLGSSCHEMKKAVDAGYFHLFRFNPALRAQGKNPFHLDSKEPVLDYETFLDGEIRYDALRQSSPEQAEELFAEASAAAADRYRQLKRLEAFYAPSP